MYDTTVTKTKIEPATMDAAISEDGKYRYWLKRRIADRGIRVLFCMLNPSTADASKDDPTIRKCKQIAARLEAAEMGVVNLFALRSSKPRDLMVGSDSDPVGPDNATAWERALGWVEGSEIWVNKNGEEARTSEEVVRTKYVGKIICAWGKNVYGNSSPLWFQRMGRDQVEDFLQKAERLGTYCVHQTDNQPWHPLYAPVPRELIKWPRS